LRRGLWQEQAGCFPSHGHTREGLLSSIFINIYDKNMKIDRVGKLLFAYQTDVYFQVHQHAVKTIIKLENHYVPFLICRDSIAKRNPMFIIDQQVELFSEPPFILPNHDKEWRS
jgi:hypothetical protein